ncbi:G1 family glutamic endopeptidase, partial [Caballeronia novacaledonica]|uniref:G1 family glutamic endopeptidase n=1 Tax=Caballeronia novacaledonica TaxID=1544861 RepID=UPI001EE26994
MCDLIKILAAAAHPVPLRKLRMTLAYAVLGTFVLICAPTLAGAQALMSPKPSAVAETPTQGGPGVGVQKTFREASVKAGPNLHCKLHERGRDPTTGITVHTDADGFARFQAVQGGQASAQQLSCKTDSGVASNYPVDLDSPQLFVSRPRDLAKEPGIERPALTGDPASYTQAQLSKLGYGLRPDRSASIYADWLTAASHPARILTVKRSNENHHSVTPVTGGAWIGSVLAGAAPYDWVMATFVVPKAVPGADGTNLTAASIWPGLGGFNTGSGLIQAGVGIQTTPSTASYSTWREYCCGDGDSNGYAGAFAPSPGDKILAQAWYCDSNGQVDINGGYGCSYVYDFASRAAFSCTSPKTGANDPPCWSVKALPTCATNPTAQNCMTLGHNAEFIMENQSPQISQAADQFPKYEPALKMSGYAHSASKGAVTLADDPSVVLLKDYPHRPPHVLVSISALGDTLMDEDPVLPVVAKQSFSVSRNFLQSDFGKQGNFELLAPQGNMIGQYYRDNNDPKLLWHFVRNFGYQGGRVPRAVTFMQSNYKGDGTHGNFEAVVRVSEQGKPDVLDFWFLNSKSFQWSGPFALLADGKQVSGVTGNPVLIQNSWGHQGNFELLVPQGNVIGEYFRDNDDAQPSWHHSRDFGYAGSPRFPVGVSFMQSNYKGDAVHGNLEAVVRVAEAGKADVLDFWYLDSRAGRWSGPFGLVADGRQATAVGDPALIQSSWGSPGNFELLVPSNGGISRYFRDNNGAGGGWHRMSDLSYPPNRSARSVALVQSNFLGDWFHGNFEVVARVAEPGKPDSLDFWFFDTQTQKW